MNDLPSLQSEAAEAQFAHISGRLRRGDNPDAVYAELVAKGMHPNIAATLVVGATPGEWEIGRRGWTLKIIGIVIILFGGFLWYGNKYGSFPTFAFAGGIVMIVGVLIYVKGGGS